MSVRLTLSSPLQQGTRLCINDMLKFFGGKNKKSLNASGVPILVVEAGPCEVRQTGDYRSVPSETAPSGMECFMQTSKEPFSTVCIQLKLKQIYDNNNKI